MTAGIAEIVGGFLVLCGLGTIVAAAAMVSPVLAIAVAGALCILVGVLALYVAVMSERRQKAAAAGAVDLTA